MSEHVRPSRSAARSGGWVLLVALAVTAGSVVSAPAATADGRASDVEFVANQQYPYVEHEYAATAAAARRIPITSATRNVAVEFWSSAVRGGMFASSSMCRTARWLMRTGRGTVVAVWSQAGQPALHPATDLVSSREEARPDPQTRPTRARRLIERSFGADALDQRWLTDIIEHPTAESNLISAL